MRNILLALFLIICAATTLPAQNPYIQGTLQGGPPAPGTKSRSPLNSLERTANNVPGATILTDTFGNQRFSMFVYIADTCFTPAPTGNTSNLNSFLSDCDGDSTWYVDWTGKSTVLFAGGGGGGVNWYTVDDTTTDATRNAYILNQAYWTGLDPNGEIGFHIGDVSTADLYLTAINLDLRHIDAGGEEVLNINTTGIDLITSPSASRAIDFTTDTMNWASSFDPLFMTINYLALKTYMHADSIKAVGIGQFDNMNFDPVLHPDGSQKGFYYYPPDGNGVWMINGEGISGDYSFVKANSQSTEIKSTFVDATYDYTENGTTFGSSSITSTIIENNSGSIFNQNAAVGLEESNWNTTINAPANFLDTFSFIQAYQTTDGVRDIRYSAFGEYDNSTNLTTSAYIGRAPTNATEQRAITPRLAFGVQQHIAGGSYLFDWLKIDLYDTITTKDAIQFYNDRYRWQNAEPSPTPGDTSFHFWAGIGSGTTNPGFMTLDQVCAHCAADAVNWYNSNGTTTDNTRIATVTETATWLSTDGQADGVYPFRFELEDGAPNEPEMMVWKFPTDSLVLAQSDVEIYFRSNTDLNNWADGIYSMRADSSTWNANSGGTQWKITPNETQNNVQRVRQNTQYQHVIETAAITGTAQTELTMPTTGSVLNVVSGTAANFEVHLTAICTAAGNGVGISTGESYASWHMGGIKNIGGTTALIGTVQTPATAQSDTGMSTSVVTIDANNTNDSLRIRFTPPSTAGSTTQITVTVTIDYTNN